MKTKRIISVALQEVGSNKIKCSKVRHAVVSSRGVILLLAFIFSVNLTVFSQQTSRAGNNKAVDIQFMPLDFAAAKQAAADQHKLIFMDASTSWCAPCRWMERNVFVDKSVADYFNNHFVNIKIDCEKGEGVELSKHYGIRSFPTYLFIDLNGTLIYRTQSRMELEEFLTQGKRANNPDYQIPNLIEGYNSGNRDSKFLLRYIQVMENVDGDAAKTALKSLDSVADGHFLESPEGWETIKMMGRNGEDKYGKFFNAHKAYFRSIADSAEFQKKEAAILRYDMYQYISKKNKAAFEKGLAYFAHIQDPAYQVETAMFKADWAGTNGSATEFKNVTDQLRKGVLKNQDERLSFIARRFGNKGIHELDTTKLVQCYILAKQAVTLNADSYSNQGTLADICINLHKKAEAIKAAKAARHLADAETSKIQKLADKLLNKAQSMH